MSCNYFINFFKCLSLKKTKIISINNDELNKSMHDSVIKNKKIISINKDEVNCFSFFDFCYYKDDDIMRIPYNHDYEIE